jgi:uncharacterized SAM-binding protein YcdF (DUF218 family)
MNASEGNRKKCWGLFDRRERWGLSLRGWLAGLIVSLLLAGIVVFNIQPFLAPTQREETKILVVEGWVQPYAIDVAVKEFQQRHYEKVFTTGGPVVGLGGYVNDFQTSASVGAEALVKAGLPAELVRMVPSHVSGRDRTYSSALALREYFRANGMAVKSFNVLTEDVHARRTRMLFQKAFGADATVGVVSAHDPDYDPAHWWRYSEGVREILGESIAWVYAAFLFHPAPPPK